MTRRQTLPETVRRGIETAKSRGNQTMPLLIQHNHAAHDLLVGIAVTAVACEIGATYFGQARSGQRRLGGSVAEALFLRKRGDATAADRWTKQILVAAVLGGFVAAWEVAAHQPRLRTYANDWNTLIAGAAVALGGVALRTWAVWTLGRFFRREVTVEAGQRLVRSGPYRWMRHPAYTGNLLTFTGIGLALGSWVSAAILLAVSIADHLPRIKVEEAELELNFGDEYRDYERTTARLIPRVW